MKLLHRIMLGLYGALLFLAGVWVGIGPEREEALTFVPTDSPEQVQATIETRDGREWVARWEEVPPIPETLEQKK